MKKLLAATIMVGAMMIAPSAYALKVLDGWQLDTTSAGGGVVSSLTTGIGHLTLGGGTATVTQEVNASNQAFVGARFQDFGLIQSLTYSPENCIGTCDSGLGLLNNSLSLDLVFTGLAGQVTNVVGQNVSFQFTTGVGTISLQDHATATVLANLSLIQPSVGSVSNFDTATGTVGTTALFGVIQSSINNLFRNSAGLSLDSLVAAGELFLNVTTTNTLSASQVPSGTLFDFGDGNPVTAAVFNVTSEGAANLLTVPEPGSLALLGIGLLGFGSTRRKAA